MNSTKTGSYSKLIAFFLIAVILLCTFGFAVEGWQTGDQELSDAAGNNSGENTANDSDSELPPEEETAKPAEPIIPKYINALTGLEITEDESKNSHICLVFSANTPLYGISSSDILVEIPTEGDTTRYIVFTSNAKKLGKIGYISPTRAYIYNISNFFNIPLISYGNDDSLVYDSLSHSSHFDLIKYSGYHYTEYSLFNYTNGDLLTAGLNNSGIGNMVTLPTLPYKFNNFGNANIIGSISAKSVTIPISSTATTEFYYSASDEKYTMRQNGSVKKDLLNDYALSFDNIFILSADTVTYENENSTQMIMNTLGSGKGVYISHGSAQSITWTTDSHGDLTFYDEAENQLTVNRGSSYIGYIKSSKIFEISIS